MSMLLSSTITIGLSLLLVHVVSGKLHVNTCRSYCGNITIDYPFSLQSGCGHPGFRDLLFCMNGFLMFHIKSGSYRVLDIDYAYKSLTLHDPHMSSCDSVVLGRKGNGFEIDSWRASYLNPTPDNVFMLIGCSERSSLFQGFPGTHLPCRNVSGMGCEEFIGCPGWNKPVGFFYGSSPPECCAVAFEAIKAINLTKLECEGYSSAYNLAPLRLNGPSEWSYGIRVRYSVHESNTFCKACEATGGTCGYGNDPVTEMCLCGNFNSTSSCDFSVSSSACSTRAGWFTSLTGGITCMMTVWIMGNWSIIKHPKPTSSKSVF